MPVRPNKYSAEPTILDGVRFGSRAEARRYGDLRLMLSAGAIRDLVVHPRFALYAPLLTGELDQDHAPPVLQLCRWEDHANPFARWVGSYTADFAYLLANDGTLVIEDVKGGRATRTEAYRLRKRMVEAMYGVTVTEVTET